MVPVATFRGHVCIVVPNDFHRTLGAIIIEMINDMSTQEATVMSRNKAWDESREFSLWICDPILSIFGSFCSLSFRGKVDVATLQPGPAKVSINSCM